MKLLGADHFLEPSPDQASSYHKRRRGTVTCWGLSGVGGGEYSISPLLYPLLPLLHLFLTNETSIHHLGLRLDKTPQKFIPTIILCIHLTNCLQLQVASKHQTAPWLCPDNLFYYWSSFSNKLLLVGTHWVPTSSSVHKNSGSSVTPRAKVPHQLALTPSNHSYQQGWLFQTRLWLATTPASWSWRCLDPLWGRGSRGRKGCGIVKGGPRGIGSVSCWYRRERLSWFIAIVWWWRCHAFWRRVCHSKVGELWDVYVLKEQHWLVG